MKRAYFGSSSGFPLLLSIFVAALPVSAFVERHAVQLQKQVPELAPALKSLQLQGKAEHHYHPTLEELVTMPAAVDRCLPFKGYVNRLADGTKLASLRDDQLFQEDSRRFIPEMATVDLSNNYVKSAIYKAFLKMDCLEFAALGANYYTAPESYESFHYGGRNIAIGASTHFESPELKLMLGGILYKVTMELPGLSSSSHNVIVITDGRHILSIDPKTSETWMLASISRVPPQLAWLKLRHNRGTNIGASEE